MYATVEDSLRQDTGSKLPDSTRRTVPLTAILGVTRSAWPEGRAGGSPGTRVRGSEMRIAYIDTTCLHEIVRTLDQPDPRSTKPWSWETAVEASCALISARNVRFPPSPTRDGAPAGALGSLLLPLSDYVGIAEANEAIVKAGRVTSKTWAAKHIPELRDAEALLMADDVNFIPWLEWFTEHVWDEHSSRLNGLFDPGYISYIGRVLDVEQKDLEQVWKLSRSSAELDSRRKRGEADPEFVLMRRAYIISALIRGRFHDDVARRSDWQIMHHPFRDSILAGATSISKADEIGVSNTERYIANILMASAYKQRPAVRVQAWVQNVIRVREAVKAGAIDARPKDSDEMALDIAVRDIRNLAIDFKGRYLDLCLGASASIGMAGYTTFFVAPWVGLGISVGSVLAGAGVTVATSIRPGLHDLTPSGRLSKRRGRLKALAKAGPGQIRRVWS